MKRAALDLLLALLAAAATLWIVPPPVCNIGSGGDLACARGFEARERSGDTTFRWSDSCAEIHFANTGYGAPLAAEVRLRSGRPAGSAPIAARFGINGHSLVDVAVPPVTRRYALLLPMPPPAGDMARLQISSATWQPTIYSRTLGLVVLRAHAHPTEGQHWPGPLLFLSWLALLLSARLLSGKRLVWGWGALLLLFPLLRFSALIAYLPWVAVIGGSAALIWARAAAQGSVPTVTVAWAGGLALLFLPFATGTAPMLGQWGQTVLLGTTGALAVVGALHGARCIQRSAISRRGALVSLLASALLLRGTLLLGRLLSGATWLDADVDLFYAYGMALREVGLPEVEYPSGALLPWAALSWLSGESRELFALALPLLNIGCDLAIVAALVQLATPGTTSTPYNPSALALAPAAFYALSPLLEPFVFAKYDALPAVLVVGALALAAANRPALAGGALGFGAAIKWTPILALPFLALWLLRSRCWWLLTRLTAASLATLAICSLPFALANLDTFLTPYRFQGERAMNGESFWALVTLLQNPALLEQLDAPWGPLRGGLPTLLMVGVQAAALGVAGLVALVRPPLLWRALALAALAPALFLILNRIFSPQYMLVISGCLLAACVLLRPSPRAMAVCLALLSLSQVSNLLVWPFFVGEGGWLLASGVLFGALLALSGWAVGAAWRLRVQEAISFVLV
jgi:hypothetical protein